MPRVKDLRTGASRATALCGWETLWRRVSWGPERLQVGGRRGQTCKHDLWLVHRLQITLVFIDNLK